MSTTTTINDDIMTLSSYAAIINETLPHNPELQLCINDLVHPTESAETLLETLSNEQLNIIEQAVNKIKERKLNIIKDQGEFFSLCLTRMVLIYTCIYKRRYNDHKYNID